MFEDVLSALNELSVVAYLVWVDSYAVLTG
jgi:hypothetical protein